MTQDIAETFETAVQRSSSAKRSKEMTSSSTCHHPTSARSSTACNWSTTRRRRWLSRRVTSDPSSTSSKVRSRVLFHWNIMTKYSLAMFHFILLFLWLTSISLIRQMNTYWTFQTRSCLTYKPWLSIGCAYMCFLVASPVFPLAQSTDITLCDVIPIHKCNSGQIHPPPC